MKCPVCDGDGGWNINFGEGTIIHEECPYCGDTGKVPLLRYTWYHIWNNMPEWAWDIYAWVHKKCSKESEEE